jgi:hypothetical protein
MNLETSPRGRPRNRWQYEVSEDGRVVGGEEWQEKVYDREWKKLLRTARNCHILCMLVEWKLLLLLLLHYYLLQLSFHSVAVVLTPVQTKQIRINIHTRNNT